MDFEVDVAVLGQRGRDAEVIIKVNRDICPTIENRNGRRVDRAPSSSVRDILNIDLVWVGAWAWDGFRHRGGSGEYCAKAENGSGD